MQVRLLLHQLTWIWFYLFIVIEYTTNTAGWPLQDVNVHKNVPKICTKKYGTYDYGTVRTLHYMSIHYLMRALQWRNCLGRLRGHTDPIFGQDDSHAIGEYNGWLRFDKGTRRQV